ncbi:putative dihydrofolate reductase [Yalta virus]|nr:putative dihydrofolate reductase [Yalta virus]QKE44623.1 putative dihydrofolate reductase [Yalta virus]
MSFKIIICVSRNLGFGNKNAIPWKIKEELRYFKDQTLTTEDSNKKNIVIMGRKTFESITNIPSNKDGLRDRINVVLSSNKMLKEKYKNHYNIIVVSDFKELESLIEYYQKENTIENYWIIGGLSLVEYGIKKNYDLYLNKIYENYECDKFLDKTLLRDYDINHIDLHYFYCDVKKKRVLINYSILKKKTVST